MKQRESNIELLRIVAMLMVLVVHADFAALGVPTAAEAHAAAGVTAFRYLWEMLSIVCVNVFVLISGWFGIRPSIKGFSKFIFQVLFFSLGVYAVGCLSSGTEGSWPAWLDMLLCRHGLYWFIPSYVLLYLFSPVVNAFVAQADKKKFGRTLILFYLFQTVYGFAFGEESVFRFGYSTMSFFGLYLLAQYAKRYWSEWAVSSRGVCLSIYLVCALVLSALGFAAAYFDVDGGQIHVIAYNNPLVVAESLAFMLLFAGFRFSSKIVNSVSASSFAVFLLHLNPYFYFEWFKPRIIAIAADYDPSSAFFLIAAFLLAVFVLAVLLDQLRILLWRRLERRLF